LDEIRNFKGTIITTHRRFLNMDADTLNNYEVIIDEDIISKAVLTNQEIIPISDLKEILTEINPGTQADKIKKILKSCKKCDKKVDFFSVEAVDIDEADYDDISDDFNYDLSALCRAEKFCFLKENTQANISEDCIMFFKPVEFPDVKLTIVSATADKNIYEYFFPDRAIHFHECKKVKYKGRLIQFWNKTMSRAYLRKNPQVFDILKERYPGIPIITFEPFKDYVDGELLHFGNAEGYDGYAGRDIVVCGTNHYPPHFYRLIAYTLGLPCDLDAELKAHQLVEHNGYRSKFTTFDDEYLKNIFKLIIFKLNMLNKICFLLILFIKFL